MRMHDDDGHKAMLEVGKAWNRIKGGQAKLWSDWTMVIGPGLMKARAEAMRIAETNAPKGRGYNTAMNGLLKEYHLNDMSETARAHILKIMENYGDVEGWRAKQPNAADLNHPTRVWMKYFRDTKPKRHSTRPAPQGAKLRRVNEELQERIKELEEELKSKQGVKEENTKDDNNTAKSDTATENGQTAFTKDMPAILQLWTEFMDEIEDWQEDDIEAEKERMEIITNKDDDGGYEHLIDLLMNTILMFNDLTVESLANQYHVPERVMRAALRDAHIRFNNAIAKTTTLIRGD